MTNEEGLTGTLLSSIRFINLEQVSKPKEKSESDK